MELNSVAGPGAGQRHLNGPQTTGRSYHNLSQPDYGMIAEANQQAPMRDGVSLLVDVIRPPASGRFPALIAPSPYPRQIQNSGAPLGFVEAGASDFFVPRGYVHVLANSRGTGGSGGNSDFFGPADRRDMHDLVEWAALQPWCDGNVGMVGISAFAMLQIAAAVEQPEHLKAIFPVATTVDVYEAAYHGGLLSETFMAGWIKSLGTLNGVSDPVMRGRGLALIERALKLPVVHSRLEHFNGEAALTVLGRIMPAHYPPHPWDELLVSAAVDHQTKDAFWQDRDYISLLRHVRVPIYLGCDWENVPLHLPSTFTALAALPSDIPVRVALLPPGGLTWPWESLHEEALAWFDQWLKGRETGVLEGPRIRYCMPGADDGWRASTAWPPEGASTVVLHLNADGSLRRDEAAGGKREYIHLPAGAMRTPHVASSIASSLTWETPALSAAVELAGPVELALEAASSAIDTGWIATLQDVDSAGHATDVTAGWLRASLRAIDEGTSVPGKPVHPFDPVQPLVPNERVSYRIALVDNALRFLPGHRIRLVLTSDDSEGEPPMMGFRHAPVGLAARNTVFSASRLLLSLINGTEALA
jgi:uncharacterized protein